MKTKKWFISLWAIGSLICFTSCLEGGGNSQSFEAVPAYVTTDGASILMQNLAYPYTLLYVSGLTNYLGKYGFAFYNIDFDNQIAGSKYYTATVSNFVPVNTTSYIQTKSGDMIDEMYKDSIAGADLFSSFLLNGYCFMAMKQVAPSNREYAFELVYNTDSTLKYERPRLYMKAFIEIPGSGAGSSVYGSTYTYFYNAFNMSYLMSSSYAKDTTDSGQNKYRLCRFDLYYQSGNDAEGRPVFEASAGNPQSIFEVKE